MNATVVLLFLDNVVFLHVSRVAEVDAARVGTLVGAVLEVDDAFSRSQLLRAEVPLVLLGRFGSQARSLVFRVQIARSSQC